MSTQKIGIIGQFNDADVQQLKACIEDRGGEARIIDLSLFPEVNGGSISSERIVYDDENILECGAFYIRRLASVWDLPLPRFTRDEWAGYYNKFNDYMDNLRAVHAFKISLARILCEQKTVVNPYQSWDFHHLKLHQFWILRENGFNVPNFMAGNNYFDLKGFLEREVAVNKPIVTGPVKMADVQSLDSERSGLRQRPTVYQKFIEGKSIRAFVLGDKVICACELPHKKWGVDASESIEYMKPIDLPVSMVKEIVRAAQTLGMVFAGVDLQYNEAGGEYYFLECNVAPYFRPYDTMVGANIGGRLADFLLERC